MNNNNNNNNNTNDNNIMYEMMVDFEWNTFVICIVFLIDFNQI